MSKVIPKKQADSIKALVCTKADKCDYITRSRTENTQFLDELVDDPEVGGVLSQFYAKGKVRTYIKDGILNAYTKKFTKDVLAKVSPTKTIQKAYNVSSSIILLGKGKESRMSVSRANDGRIFVVSGGTVLKWETALRTALELVARMPKLSINGKPPEICLQLVATNNSLTAADKKHIKTALAAVGVEAIFYNN